MCVFTKMVFVSLQTFLRERNNDFPTTVEGFSSPFLFMSCVENREMRILKIRNENFIGDYSLTHQFNLKL